jgi:propionyl-CoA synthetase
MNYRLNLSCLKKSTLNIRVTSRNAVGCAKFCHRGSGEILQPKYFGSASCLSHFACRTLTTEAKYPPFDRESIKGEFGAYAAEYDRSLQDPEGFWAEAASSLHWFEDPRTTVETDEANPHLHRWFPDGKINTCYNCLDVHVANGDGERVAFFYDSPLTGTKKQFTYSDLLEQVSLFAGALKNDLGVQVGDRVVIYMPMIPESIIAMLACTRIGAIHSVVFGGFASHELATRITDCQPKVVISASAGKEPNRVIPYKPLLEKALEIADHSVGRVVIVQRPNVLECKLGPKDVDYEELMANASPTDAVPVLSTHPHYVLYTSGTTGLPKGVVRDTGGTAVALKYSMDRFFGMKPGDVFWTASDIGWVVGHAYIVYAPLMHGCTSILYEGKPVGTPDAGAYWRVISEYGVKALFTAPTVFRAIKQADPNAEIPKQYDLSTMETLFLAGEHSGESLSSKLINQSTSSSSYNSVGCSLKNDRPRDLALV